MLSNKRKLDEHLETLESILCPTDSDLLSNMLVRNVLSPRNVVIAPSPKRPRTDHHVGLLQAMAKLVPLQKVTRVHTSRKSVKNSKPSKDVIKYAYVPPNEFGVRMVVPFQLLEHQIDPVRFMIECEEGRITNPHFIGIGYMLAMHMGLGKSVSIGTVNARTVMQQRLLRQPTLFLTEKVLLGEIRNEFVKFFGDQLKLLIYHRDFLKSKYLKITAKELATYDVIFTTEATIEARLDLANTVLASDMQQPSSEMQTAQTQSIATDQPKMVDTAEEAVNVKNAREFGAMLWYRVVVDESHGLRNRNTKRFKACNLIRSKIRVCMTGTPIQNDIKDLFTQLEFCGLRLAKGVKKNLEVLKNLRILDMVKFVDLRDATSVKLPAQIVSNIFFELSTEERFLHSFYESSARQALRDASYLEGSEKVRKSFEINSGMIRAMQVCSAPYLVTKASKMGSDATVEDMASVEEAEMYPDAPGLHEWVHKLDSAAGIHSSKMCAFRKLLDDLRPSNAKIIIFANFSSTLRLAIEGVPELKDQLIFVHGDIKSSCARDALFQKFRTDSKIKYLFMTLKIGGFGLNLVEASVVIFLENWYNYQAHNQAACRVHRIGQTKPVNVFYLTAKETVEERIHAIAQAKKLIPEKLRTQAPTKIVLSDIYHQLFGR